MTDNEIIKALECCPNTNHCELCDCKEYCPNDFEELMKLALDLINRTKLESKKYRGKCQLQKKELALLNEQINHQKAEIKRLKEIEYMYNDLCK